MIFILLLILRLEEIDHFRYAGEWSARRPQTHELQNVPLPQLPDL